MESNPASIQRSATQSEPNRDRSRLDNWTLWLIVGLPLTAVFASSVTAWLAIAGQDPVIETARERLAPNDSMTPAHQARNSSATDALQPAGRR